MRGRGNNYSFVGPMILDILEKSKAPIQALCVSFKVNEISGKIINFNVIKNYLEDMVEKKKAIKITNKDEIVLYSLKN